MNQLTLSQDAADLLSLWHDARGDNPLPDAKFIDPIKLRRWIGDISVVHLHEGEKRLFVALHGSNVVRHLGPDFHHKYLEASVPAEAVADTTAPYDLSEKTNQPTYSIQRASLSNGLFKSLERMVMPCSTENPEKTGRFLIWVAPIESNARSSSSIFVPFDNAELLGIESAVADRSAQLFLLSDKYLIASDVG